MATALRTIVMDKPVGPAFPSGLQVFAGALTGDNGQTATFTIPCKGVYLAFATAGTAVRTPTVSIANDIATVVFTFGADETIQYLIIVNRVDSITHPDIGPGSVSIGFSNQNTGDEANYDYKAGK